MHSLPNRKTYLLKEPEIRRSLDGHRITDGLGGFKEFFHKAGCLLLPLENPTNILPKCSPSFYDAPSTSIPSCYLKIFNYKIQINITLSIPISNLHRPLSCWVPVTSPWVH